jgi:hypothetical protein
MLDANLRASFGVMIKAGRLLLFCSAMAVAPRPAQAMESPEAAPADMQQAGDQRTEVPRAELPGTGTDRPATVGAKHSPGETVRLEFRDQPWMAVLEWLAETRKLNLDWQQLPQGTLNLVSTKEYSIEEAEDLINMQLLARGFTLLQRGEVLRVAPLAKMDITLVPKVTPEELATLPRHRFVRVSFPLDWMIADEAANEFKPLVSPYGQLFPMASSNRLEAMDAVVNLRELHRLLTRAEADEGRRERVAEFRLEHRKAQEVAVKVRQLLGLPPQEAADVNTLTQLDIEKTKLRSEAVKQLGTSAQPLLQDKPDVHLVVNEEENSILVNGRPDKIEIARQAIQAMDKPLPPGESAWESINRVKVYEVNGFDPSTVAQLMQSLQRRGNLDKDTRIQHEAAYNRLVVFASPEDQVTIANVIASFRTQGRRAEVLPLARIDPQYASKAVQLVLKNPDRPQSAPGVASEGKFQVEPDVKHKRLLLWATPAEVAEVREFLTRLGESFSTAQAGTQMHVVHLRGAKAAEVTKRLKRVWNEISDAPLVVEGEPAEPAVLSAAQLATPVTQPAAIAPVASQPVATASTTVAQPDATTASVAQPTASAESIIQTAATVAQPAASNPSITQAAAPPPAVTQSAAPAPATTQPAQVTQPPASNTQPAAPATPASETDKTIEPMSDRTIARPTAQFVVQQKPVSEPAAVQQAASEVTQPALDVTSANTEPMAPVRVITGEDGDMVIVSRDPVAAETAKEFVEQIVPGEGDVQVIQLKHAQATMVKTQLDTLLEHTRSYDSSTLSSDSPLRIESDLRTNRLIVQHATARQMRLINEMVPQLDQPEQEDSRLVRQQRIYRAQRKRAAEIAEIVKEVYRDLLSSSDKVFAGRETSQPFGYNRALAATTKSPEYQGLLAVGVDDEGNTLILSAPAYIMEEVMKVVLLVDASAGGERVVVVPLKAGTARASLGEALKRMLAKPQ